MGTTMPILCPIHPTPLTSGLRLVRRGLGLRDREGTEEREAKKRERDVAGASRRKESSKLYYYVPEPIYIPNLEDQPPTVANNQILTPGNSKGSTTPL